MKQNQFSNANISLDLTEECNLACSYCFTWSKDHKKRVLPYDLGTKIIKHWLENGHSVDGRPRELTFWGGEPLLEWDLLKRLLLFTEKVKGDQPVIYGGTTNGTLYTPDKVEWLREHNSLMLVSLDGIEATHDHCRKFKNGRGSWDLVVKNLREALKIAPMQKVRSSITVQSAPYFLDTVQFFVEDLGITDFAFSPVYEDKWEGESFSILEEQFKLTIDYLIKKRKEGNPVAVKHFDDEALRAEQCIDKLFDPARPCGAAANYSGWSVEGINFPCHRFNKHNVPSRERYKSPAALGWLDKSGAYVDSGNGFRDTFLAFKDEPSEACTACKIYRRSSCNGGCYALNYDFTKDIHGAVKSQCDFAKIQKEAGVYYSNELKKNDLFLGQQRMDNRSCICYNMCYAENTPKEIIHKDVSTDMSCICYNASYQYTQNEQARPLRERQTYKGQIAQNLITSLKGHPQEKLIEKAVRILETT